MLQEFFSFQGRLNRKRFWLYNLLLMTLIVVSLLLLSLIPIFSKSTIALVAPVYVMLYVVCSISYISVAVRRLHDIGRSGYHYFLFFVPLYNFYLGILLGFKRGLLESNQYGESRI
jgi:uncharacterized membrane protein YhaH (DUF805 family)